jgi:hypothetical protein
MTRPCGATALGLPHERQSDSRVTWEGLGAGSGARAATGGDRPGLELARGRWTGSGTTGCSPTWPTPTASCPKSSPACSSRAMTSGRGFSGRRIPGRSCPRSSSDGGVRGLFPVGVRGEACPPAAGGVRIRVRGRRQGCESGVVPRRPLAGELLVGVVVLGPPLRHSGSRRRRPARQEQEEGRLVGWLGGVVLWGWVGRGLGLGCGVGQCWSVLVSVRKAYRSCIRRSYERTTPPVAGNIRSPPHPP